MRVDPFDLSTWHNLDYRARRADAGPMTRLELALEYVKTEIALRAANGELDAAKLALATEEAKKKRVEGEFNQTLDRNASKDDCATRAVTFADAVASLRAADARFVMAGDRLTACTGMADRALEALIASGA